MFRTRDFILIFTSVVFLLLAIGTTTLFQHFRIGEADKGIKFIDNEGKDYMVEVGAPETISRADRLAEMKNKIAASGDLAFFAPEPEVEESVAEEATTVVPEVGKLNNCLNYTVYTGIWPNPTKFTAVEGARIAYTESEIEKEIKPATASSSAVIGTELVKNVLLQLPLYPIATGNNCLASDVIGVAQEGSLIRNNEAGLYGVFGSETLIGYALDGFPIYGVSSEPGDVCGGRIVNGQYAYYLAKDREVILNCFKGQPANL